MKSFVRITKDKVPQLEKLIRDAADLRVLVGVPADKASRPGEPINNAEIAYIHNFGAPDANIPQREFMAPGVEAVLPAITDRLRASAASALNGDTAKLEQGLHGVGLIVQASIKKTIVANIPPPLAPSTVAARIARRKSATWRNKRKALVAANVAAGKPPGAGIFTALIDTGALLNSITYVIRRVSTRKDIAKGPP
jgi:hypothetical protein